MKSWIAIAVAGLMGLPAFARNLNEYPLEINGKKRVAINLPTLNDNEIENYKIEIVLARDLAESDCNWKFMEGTLDKGYLSSVGEYWEVNSDGGYSSTRMGCFEPKKPETIRGARQYVHYNSLTVVYVTDKVHVQYRVLKADGAFRNP